MAEVVLPSDGLVHRSVALLLPTTPAAHLTGTDRRSLGRLADLAVNDLEASVDPAAWPECGPTSPPRSSPPAPIAAWP